MNDDTNSKIDELAVYERNMNSLLAQKQNINSNILEIKSALKELETSPTSYKIIGNIMVQANKEDLKKDLDGRQEELQLKLKNLEKRENDLITKTQKLQEEVMELLKQK